MLLIWGTKGYVRFLGIVMLLCQRCSTPAAQRLERVQRKFTFFFVPLFPISNKYVMTCTFCGQAVQLPQEDAERLAAQGAEQHAQAAAQQGHYPSVQGQFAPAPEVALPPAHPGASSAYPGSPPPGYAAPPPAGPNPPSWGTPPA